MEKEDKKIISSKKINDYEVLTDDGFVDIEYLHTTIPYDVYHLKLDDGKELKCADNHIVFYPNNEEVFVKNLKIGDYIIVKDDKKVKVESIENLNYKENMFDLQLPKNSNHRYYTDDILSHNTYLAKILAETWFNRDMIRVDMSEYMEKHNTSKLIGAPPGYVGHESAGQLTEKVRRNPYSLILLDEIEKAHPDTLNMLLQMFDEGHLTDGQGRKVNFKNTIIIMTSNLGAKKSLEKSVGFGANTDVNQHERLEKTTKDALNKHFPPELINRIDEVVVFNTLDKKDIVKILDIELGITKEMLSHKKIKLRVGPKVKDKIIEDGFDENLGARPLARAVDRIVKDSVTDYLLDNMITGKCTLSLKWDDKEDKVIITTVSKKDKDEIPTSDTNTDM